ncbi:Cysteine desulfurase SufS [Rubrobacter xylanophilus DSM 9941]|uniref:cysteine desulfurase n=1 Tax=Rubrobacter xylanophilus TaxID=49319 RepID=UPI001C63BF79|nr:cysteine desulfurase [Rubrobacter xylanophilus]QYJ16391.1 Cysteine desulfurase SufS [Rubrobacter xylanophilus DSM 9941]
MYDVLKVRRDFPILEREVNGRPLVYLDNAATSQKPLQVVRTLAEYYERHNANIHRGVHRLAEEATGLYEEARGKVARFIGAPDARSLVFTRGTTESINLVAHAWGRRNLREGDEVVLTVSEHHSNLVPWQLAARDTGARLRFVPIREDGTLDMEAAERLIGPRTRLVGCVHASNVLGTVNPVERLAELAHASDALMLVDGAQSAPHLPVDVKELGCDFFAASGHKMLGPTGVGFLWSRPELLEEMEPFLGGGEMIREVHLERSTWNEIPYKFEAGTMNIAQAIGLGAAVDYLNTLGMENVREHERRLGEYARRRLSEIEGLTVYGPAEGRTGVVAFNVPGVHPHDLSQLLDQEGIAIRSGHHCCQPLMRHLRVVATARASLYLYNTEEEVDALVGAISRAREFFGAPA